MLQKLKKLRTMCDSLKKSDPELYPVDSLIPSHDVQDEQKLSDLTNNMQLNGWQGDPLVGYDLGDDVHTQLMIGTHRYNAAKKAGIEHIPVHVFHIKDRMKRHSLSQLGDESDKWQWAIDNNLDPEIISLLAREVNKQ